jgi:hypothetical protein
MATDDLSDMSNRGDDLGDIVRRVATLGERARFLSVQLAVAAAKVQQTTRAGTQSNNDILDLVARVTRLSQAVNDAVSAIEQGLPQTRMSVPGLWPASETAGVPNTATLDRLTRSIDEATMMADRVFTWVRTNTPTATPANGEKRPDDIPWVDGSQDRSLP